MRPQLATALLLFGAMAGASCDARGTPSRRAADDTGAYLDAELEVLRRAAGELSAAAPPPDDDGWNQSLDPMEVGEMREAWLRLRTSYGRVEGLVGPLWPPLDRSIGATYDVFLEESRGSREPGELADGEPFDGEGVTGMHAIERILWADAHPRAVIAHEAALPGYAAAAFPATEAEARLFRDGLLGRLAGDIGDMEAQSATVSLDPATAFRGVTEAVSAQSAKVRVAAAGADESRYAGATLGDLRANLEGGRELYSFFRPWLVQQGDGPVIDAAVVEGFDRVARAYAAIPGDALPEVPLGWDAASPTATDLATPYGALVTLWAREDDREDGASLAGALDRVADVLGLPRPP